MRIELPRYVTPRQRKTGIVFYFSVPIRLRPPKWPKTIRLPDDMGEAIRQAHILNARLDSERAGLPLLVLPQGSIPTLVAKYQASEQFKKLSPHTKRLYIQTTAHILAWSQRNGNPSIKDLERPTIFKFLNKFEKTPTLRKKIGNMLRLICNFAIDLGELKTNPALNLRLSENRKDPHIFTDEEITKLVAAAHKLNLQAVAIAILVGVNIGQRKGDILRLKAGINYTNGNFLFTQRKTKEPMKIPAPMELRRLLADTKEGFLIGAEISEDRMAHLFSYVRDEAGITKDAKFMHLRHTACVRLQRAGCTANEIAAISGHTLQSVNSILKRYIPRDEITAQNAIKKLEKYNRKKRSTLA